MDIYKLIVQELQKQGHNVHYIEDIPCRYNPYFHYQHNFSTKIKNLIKYILSKMLFSYDKYWNKQLKNIDNKKFDCLFVINGFSYHHTLLNRLKTYNPNIQTRLYLWDNEYAYSFNRITNDFDKCYSLDWDDATNYNKISFLPTFWTEGVASTPNKYKVFMLGTNHDDRAFIAKEISKQLDSYNMPYYIKIADKNKAESGLYTNKYLTPKEYIELMKLSECILDTERPTQNGPTVRMIWAIAMGKKIISTNPNIKKMPFYNKEQIHIIDRKSPVVDKDFLNHQFEYNITDYISKLRIDCWINTILTSM